MAAPHLPTAGAAARTRAYLPEGASARSVGGTLVLAVVTFASVRSANRAARTAERSLAISLRPVLFPVERVGEVVYLAMSLRNVGSGIAVSHAWGIETRAVIADPTARPDLDLLRAQSRDLYVAPGDVSFWQGAGRAEDDPFRPADASVLDEGGTLVVDLLYGDHEGGQRTMSRFLLARKEGDDRSLCSEVRHWHLYRVDPRG